jgi:hypothetical protein
MLMHAFDRYGLSGGSPNEKGLKVDAEVCGVTLEHEISTSLTPWQ